MIPKIISSKGIKNPEKLLTDKETEFEKDWGKGVPELILEVNGFVDKVIYIDGNGIDDCTISCFEDGGWKELITLTLDKWQAKREFDVNKEITKIKFSGNLLPKYIEFHGKPIEKPEPTPIKETQKIVISGGSGSFEDGEKFVLTFDKKPKEFSIVDEAARPEPIPEPLPEKPIPEEPKLEVGKFIFHEKKYEGIRGYAIRFPEDYNESGKEYPLIIALHGNGEKAQNISLQTLVTRYPAKALPTDCIALVPQANFTWYNKSHSILKALKTLIDVLILSTRVDEKRIYITGLSDGGMGTWDFVALFPELIAAAVPICGVSRADLCPAKDVPIWAFHNEGDKTVGVGGTLQAVADLEECGSTVIKKTIYPVSGHDAWSKTYNNKELWKWLYEQSK